MDAAHHQTSRPWTHLWSHLQLGRLELQTAALRPNSHQATLTHEDTCTAQAQSKEAMYMREGVCARASPSLSQSVSLSVCQSVSLLLPHRKCFTHSRVFVLQRINSCLEHLFEFRLHCARSPGNTTASTGAKAVKHDEEGGCYHFSPRDPRPMSQPNAPLPPPPKSPQCNAVWRAVDSRMLTLSAPPICHVFPLAA